MTPNDVLNDMLNDLGESQDAEDWTKNVPTGNQWFIATHPDGRRVSAWIHHASFVAIGFDSVTLDRV